MSVEIVGVGAGGNHCRASLNISTNTYSNKQLGKSNQYIIDFYTR